MHAVKIYEKLVSLGYGDKDFSIVYKRIHEN